MKYIFGFIGIILLVTGVFWVLGWLMVPGQVTSADNVQQQWAFAYQYDESLKAIATQVCTADKAVDTAMSDEEKAISRAESKEGTLKERDVRAAESMRDEVTQRRSQEMAYEQNYARVAAEYNTKLRNAFEAKHVAPNDVPRIAPTLLEMKRQVCAQ